MEIGLYGMNIFTEVKNLAKQLTNKNKDMLVYFSSTIGNLELTLEMAFDIVYKDKDDLVNALRASATVPEVAGGPVVHRGHRLVDAAVFEAVPFRSAIADGCTHVLVLCTRPAAPPTRSLIDQALTDAVEVAVKKAIMSPSYMVPAWKAEVETLVKDGLNQDEMLLRSFDEDAEQLPWFSGSHVFPIYPAGKCPSPVCTDVAQLKAGVVEGRRAVMTVLKAALGDVLDFSQYVEEASQIVPLRRGGKNHVLHTVNGQQQSSRLLQS